ncbi:MAG: GcrA family cell cycle regulator [Allopontixanthobacter sediminis]
MSWTDERIGTLKKMWEGGSTASQIAEELGGVSRNAVIGKAHRLGLKSRPSPVKANDKKADPKAPAPKPAAKKAAPKPAARPAPVRPQAAKHPPRPVPPVASHATPEGKDIPSQPMPNPSNNLPKIVSVGPGGFLRQGPGDQQPPIPPAPPRRLVPAKPSPSIAGKTTLLDLNDKVCRWPMGHPGEPDFHFCGQDVNPGFPYCVEHCGRAFQAQLPRGSRRPPPPLPFGGPRVR